MKLQISIGASMGGVRIRDYREGDGPAIMALERKRHRAWREKGADVGIDDIREPEWAGCVVIEDEDGSIIGAIGARPVAELSTTIDPEKLSIHGWRDALMYAWPRLGAQLYKQGFKEAVCRVVSPTPGWTAMLKKRGNFYESPAPVLFFDLEAACVGLKNPND